MFETNHKSEEYFVIPVETMQTMVYYIKNETDIFSYKDTQMLLTLNIDDIHFDKNDTINKYINIFKTVYGTLVGEGNDDDDIKQHEIYLIIEALEKRKQAIKDITFDVLKKRAIEANVCGNL